jgi:SOS-response transcriptional repressor LexA
MLKPLAAKIDWLLSQPGMTRARIVEATGSSGLSTVSEWRRTGRIAKPKLLALAALSGVNVDWWIDDNAPVPPPAQPPGNVEPGPDLRGTVPLISWVEAGSWNGAADPFQPGDAERWLECPVRHSERTYALRVRGDSMTAPYGRSYPEGCIIFVDPLARSPVSGQRIIAKLCGADEVTFKTFRHEDGRIWLQPLNPQHPPIFEKFRVLGTVIGKWEDE